MLTNEVISLTISDCLIFSFQVLQHAKCSLQAACLEKSLFISVACFQLRWLLIVKVNSQRNPRKYPPALDSKVRQGKQKSCIKLDRIFQSILPLIPRSIKSSFLGPKHAYRISTQPNLLWVVNSQIISISRFSFAHRPTCSRCSWYTAASRRAETFQTFRTFTRIKILQPISQTHFAPFTYSMNKQNENICCSYSKYYYLLSCRYKTKKQRI